MSSAIVTIMMAALMLTGVAILGQGSFNAMGQISDSFKDMELRSAQRVRTDIRVISTSYATATLDVTLRNEGGEPIRDFDRWDLVVQYYEAGGTYHTAWLPFTEASPVTDNLWGVTGIYLDAATLKAEASQPNILDPQEEAIFRVILAPAADADANNLVVVGTPNGVTVSSPF